MARHTATPATDFLARQGVPEYEVVKTLVMEMDKGELRELLMHR